MGARSVFCAEAVWAVDLGVGELYRDVSTEAASVLTPHEEPLSRRTLAASSRSFSSVSINAVPPFPPPLLVEQRSLDHASKISPHFKCNCRSPLPTQTRIPLKNSWNRRLVRLKPPYQPNFLGCCCHWKTKGIPTLHPIITTRKRGTSVNHHLSNYLGVC